MPFALALIVALGLLPGLTPALAQDGETAPVAGDNIVIHMIKSVGGVFGRCS